MRDSVILLQLITITRRVDELPWRFYLSSRRVTPNIPHLESRTTNFQSVFWLGWEIRSAECECGMRSAENGKCGVWKMRSILCLQYQNRERNFKRTVFKYFPENANVLTERTDYRLAQVTHNYVIRRQVMPHCETFMCRKPKARSTARRYRLKFRRGTKNARLQVSLFLDSLPKLRSMINLRRRPTVILNLTYFFYFNHCPLFSANQTSAGNFELSSVSQPSFIRFFLAWFFVPIICRPRVRLTGDVAPEPPIFSSASVNEFFNKAFVWFVHR